ncbi:MAG TPA: pantoate--beta-alanine ligase [Candidatus Luteimonas excrementigallinarum]|nr:pantoate--beta-alanine ligase [Candidatus Luteimonas excrementigallinarum]
MASIETITALEGLRQRVAGWKREGLRVGFVPTMGNLHAGHHSLVRLARAEADRVVASVFVNPTQFGPDEDFDRYPRTPDEDAAGLEAAGCDVLWLPSVETMYPFGADNAVQMRVPGVTDVLEGERRPGHFDGVATVVSRLFNQVQPDVAAFGRKDYQQLAVIRYLVRDLAFPIRLLAGDTLREADGLAMSSRNRYLSAAERGQAVEIHQTLQAMRERLVGGSPADAVESMARQRLQGAGFEVDYAAVRTPELVAPVDSAGRRVLLIAARLGSTRLIDNLEFELAGT